MATASSVPSWLAPRSSATEKKIAPNIYLSNDAKGPRLRYRGLDPVTLERVQRSKQFPPGTTPEELDRFLAFVNRRQELWKLFLKKFGKHLREDGRYGWHQTGGAPSRAARALTTAKWITVAEGIDRSAYGWKARWYDTHPVTGERRQRTKLFPTTLPPGDSERPPEHVRRFREQQKRLGLDGKRSRRDHATDKVRTIRIASAPTVVTPKFTGPLFRRLLAEAHLSLAGAAIFFGVGETTIKRHRNGERHPTPDALAIYERKLSERLGRRVSFTL